MKQNFDACLAELWEAEGGYSDHRLDPGGATKYGITIDTLRSWRGKPVTKADVQALTRDEAARIYKAWYWSPLRCDDLPSGLDAVGFDAAVNSGPMRAAKWLQGALGVTADGKVGPATISAAAKSNAPAVIDRALDARLASMRTFKDAKGNLSWPTFGKGWTLRVERLRAFAKRLAAADAPRPTPKPAPSVAPPPPARVDASSVPVVILIGAAIAGVAVFQFFGG